MSIPSWAVPGAKVVCVDARYFETHLVEGAVYTIVNVEDPYIELIETPGVIQRYGGWRWARFRPLVDTTTDDEVEQRLFRKKRLHQPVSARLTA